MYSLRDAFPPQFFLLLLIPALAGCGNSCYAGFSNNGTGFIIGSTNSGSCSLANGMGKMGATMEKTAPCATCATAPRVEHAFVTVRAISVRAASGEWVNLSPDLPSAPRQIDLLGDGAPEVLADGAPLAAGTYTQVRVEFADDVANNETSRCGVPARNCLLFAGGRVDAMEFAGGAAQVTMPLPNDAVMVVPGGRVNVNVKLQPHPEMRVSETGVATANVLAGTASVTR